VERFGLRFPGVELASTAVFQLAEVPTGDKRQTFERDYKASVAKQMRVGGAVVSAADVTVTGIRAGSVIVDFQVVVRSDGATGGLAPALVAFEETVQMESEDPVFDGLVPRVSPPLVQAAPSALTTSLAPVDQPAAKAAAAADGGGETMLIVLILACLA
jgi:hypothetical protein